MARKISLIYLTTILILGVTAIAWAQQGDIKSKDAKIKVEKEEKQAPGIKSVNTNEVVGEMVSFSPLKDPQFITIAYEKDGVGCDALFKIGAGLKLQHIKSLDELKMGDNVGVLYREVVEVNEEGREVTNRVAFEIRYAGPAAGTMPKRKLPGEEPPVPEPEQPEALQSVEDEGVEE